MSNEPMHREFSDIHERLWDPERHMVRRAPGAAPDDAVGAVDVHAVRETALAAFFDLDGGRTERANRALREVLSLQYELSGRPWSGTFPVTAEQPEPPGDDARVWVHYDPNWRQFLGCILQLTSMVHGADLAADVRAGISTAVERCVAGEPAGRIAPSYTNPNVMHAWLRGFVEPDAGVAHASMIVDRLRRSGDIDEYNSPTYDGIDLFALALWVEHPPTPDYVAMGEELLDRICARVSALYHPGLAAMCGPYLRAYGLDLQAYVSLIGIWWALVGEPAARVLPRRLDEHTDHVHDLFFLPVFERVAGPVIERLRIVPVDEPRQWRQQFGDAVAESVLRRDRAVGWDTGRRGPFTPAQYVPFVAHVERAGGVTSLGVLPTLGTTGIDGLAVTPDVFQLTLRGDDGPVGLCVRSNEPIEERGGSYRTGPYLVTLAPYAADESIERTSKGFELRASWTLADTTIRVTLGR